MPRVCSYSGKGFCALHGPGAKSYWKPKTRRVTDQDGVTRLKTERLYYYVCDLGPQGRGKLIKQTSISGLLSSNRGGREENSTVGEKTLLRRTTTPLEGQGDCAVSMAGITRDVGV